MIFSVMELGGRLTAGDDASRTTGTATGGRHRVFMVITTRMGRQAVLEIIEDDSIAAKRKWPAPVNQVQRFACLWRQLPDADSIACRGCKREADAQQGKQVAHDQ